MDLSGNYQDLEECPNTKFFTVLRQYSDNKHDPIPEWQLVGFVERGGKDRCICGTAIMLNYMIRHKISGVELIIGSECVKRWMDPKIVCERCKEPLGRVLERYRRKDFKCRSCKLYEKELEEARERAKRIAEQRLKALEEEKMKKIERMGNLRLLWYGKYYQQPFSKVAEDIPYCEYLLNIPEDKATKTILAFIDYANLVFEIADRPG